jgi:L-fuculose-phosphate aldolase
MNQELVSKLTYYAHKVYHNGYGAAYDGNLSVRHGSAIYITATRTNKETANPADISVVDLSGNLLEGQRLPSTELAMHLFIYNSRPDVGGIVHTHPVFATAFAAARQGLTKPVFPEVVLDLGDVPLCNYATPSTEEVAASIKPHVQANAFLLANHGAVALGGDVDEAYFRLEKLEHSAKTIFFARLLGGEVPLTDSQVDYLFETHPQFKPKSSHQPLPDMDCHSCREKTDIDNVAEIAKRVLKRL